MARRGTCRRLLLLWSAGGCAKDASSILWREGGWIITVALCPFSHAKNSLWLPRVFVLESLGKQCQKSASNQTTRSCMDCSMLMLMLLAAAATATDCLCGWFGQLIAIQSRANPWLIYTSDYLPVLANGGVDGRYRLWTEPWPHAADIWDANPCPVTTWHAMSQVHCVERALRSHCRRMIFFPHLARKGGTYRNVLCVHVLYACCCCLLLLCFAKWGCNSANSNASWIMYLHFVDGWWMFG